MAFDAKKRLRAEKRLVLAYRISLVVINFGARGDPAFSHHRGVGRVRVQRAGVGLQPCLGQAALSVRVKEFQLQPALCAGGQVADMGFACNHHRTCRDARQVVENACAGASQPFLGQRLGVRRLEESTIFSGRQIRLKMIERIALDRTIELALYDGANHQPQCIETH
jgi:hypothetical protein